MPPPPKPNPPVLFGTSPAERELSRRSDALRFDWTNVAGAASYDIRFGAADVRPNVSKGSFLGGLQADSFHSVRLRAVNAQGASPWSDAATYPTRPTRPPAPFLSSAADRRHDSLVLTWNPVNGLSNYDLRVNGDEFPAPVQRPFTLHQLPTGGLLVANAKYEVEVRARDDAVGGVSDWSDAAVFVTRPPRPAPPTRVRYDLTGWGIVLRWSVTATFNAGNSAFVRLSRIVDGTASLLLDGESSTGGRRSYRFVDSRHHMTAVKEYRLQIVVPAAAVPAPIPEDGGENRSFESEHLVAQYPICLTALRPMTAGGVLRRNHLQTVRGGNG